MAGSGGPGNSWVPLCDLGPALGLHPPSTEIFMFSGLRLPRSWPGVALLLALALLAASCGSSEGARSATTAETLAASAGSGSSFASVPCPNPMYEGFPQLDLGPEADCGYLTVPERRNVADASTIRLPVARLKATSAEPKPDPIVYLAGGPGDSALFAKAAKTWNRDRDVILFGQRGTLKAEPFLTCPEVDAFYAQAAGLSWEDPATAGASAAAAHACRDRLVAQGADLSAYSTAETSADLADLRVAFGLDEINIYGISYGSDLALQTIRDHPEGIRSVVLDSVLPPQENIIENGWDSAAQSFRAIFDACAADATCSAAYPHVAADFTRLVTELSANPRTVIVKNVATGQDVPVVIDGYKFANGVVVNAAQSPGMLAQVPALIEELAAGDGTRSAAFLLKSNPPKIVSFGLQYSVVCGEMAARTDPARVLAAGRRALPDFPDAVLAQPSQLPFIFGDCRQWDVPRADDHVSTPSTSTIPVLGVAGSFDSATPPSFAQEAARSLPNARVFVFPGAGHGIAGQFTAPCFETVMGNFLESPDNYDASCVQSVAVPAFEVH
jgi:pimeloyl-ACP methyl ester carboxylesterase